MKEREKTIKYIATLEGTIPKALLKDSKELSDAKVYLATLDKAIAEAEAKEKKKLEAERKAKAKRLEKNKSQCNALQEKAFKLREEVLAIQSTLEPEYKKVFGDIKFGLTQAIGRYSNK